MQVCACVCVCVIARRFLANVSSYTETPAVACVVSGFLAALLSLLVSLRDLIEMMSIGTLLAYTLVRTRATTSWVRSEPAHEMSSRASLAAARTFFVSLACVLDVAGLHSACSTFLFGCP